MPHKAPACVRGVAAQTVKSSVIGHRGRTSRAGNVGVSDQPSDFGPPLSAGKRAPTAGGGTSYAICDLRN